VKKFPPAIAVDFDNTITVRDGFTENLDEIPPVRAGVAELIRRAKASGAKVIIHSCRFYPQPDEPNKVELQRALVAKFLTENEIPFDELHGKPFAEFYWDDKAVYAKDLKRVDHLVKRLERESKKKPQKVEANDGKRNSSYLLAMFPDDKAAKIKAWVEKNVTDEDLWNDPKQPDKFGIEEQIHTTVAAKLTDDDPEAMKTFLEENKALFPLKIVLGRVMKFTTNPAHDVLEIELEAKNLLKLNSKIKSEFGHNDSRPTFVPHVTLAYLKKGACENLVEDETFMGEEVEFSTLEFSSPDSKRTPITVEAALLPVAFKTSFGITANSLIKPRLADYQTLLADKFSDIYRTARSIIESDPKWRGNLDDPAVAQQFGELQQALNQCRDESTLRQIWDKFQPSIPFEALEAEPVAA
jgi:2'-5' RNA ligase